MNDQALHATLRRQLRRLDLAAGSAPSSESLHALLATVSLTYEEADEERYTLERSIEVSSREMRGLHEVLTRQALQDALTGLPNRAALLRHLESALIDCTHGGPPVTVLFIDLDGFKLVNDSLGHAVGDELLVRTAERISACVLGGDVVARLGGDEFVVVLCLPEGRGGARRIADRILGRLGKPFRINGVDAVVSASVGIASTLTGAEGAEELIRDADLAMYQAKTAGKARIEVFDAGMQQDVDFRLSVRSALTLAIRRDELRLVHQPMVSLTDGRFVGTEALVRWARPGHGLLSPDQFVPVAEESPLISAVDCWVVREACRQASWLSTGGQLSVNVSARTLEDERFVAAVTAALHESAANPGQLSLEITETALLHRSSAVMGNLERLRGLGVQLSLDDFGTGWSSLSQLRSTSVQVLKIDRSFVQAMDQDDSSTAIVRAIVAMAHAMGHTVVAEGVEQEYQANALRQMGCDLAQGWLFGRPVSAGEIELLVRRDNEIPRRSAGSVDLAGRTA